MTPPTGTIAHYRIVSKLGEGGMGAVYRATDTKLNRDVAIKVLPPAFAEDSARMQRFEREAQVLASLNHPNIAAIYGIEAGALVMELVEGADLAGPVPLGTALAYASQIAAALEAAHEKGIVHRDLKPANIKVTPDGVVKLLDFGLATAAPESAPGVAGTSPAMSPTLSVAMTQAGMILGTAAYMAPEQAAGKPVDRRADIWAFGVVLWEMLCGRKLFEGESVMHTLAEVVNGKIDLDKLPAGTPHSMRELLRRCLDRDVKTRLRDIGEARVAIQNHLADPTPPVALPEAASSKGWPGWMVAALAVGVVIVSAGALYWQRQTLPPEAQTARFLLTPPSGHRFLPTSIAVSPDGRYVAAVAQDAQQNRQIWLREIDSTTMRRLPGTDDATFAFWSPDGRSIGFAAGATYQNAAALKRVALAGGPAQVICEGNAGIDGATWNADGVILFSSTFRTGPARNSLGGDGRLQRVGAGGGSPSPALPLGAGDSSHRFPQFLPDGRHFLYLALSTQNPRGLANAVMDRQGIYLASLEGKEPPLRLLETSDQAVFAPDSRGTTGYLFFRRAESLMAVRLDWGRGQLEGDPFPVVESVSYGGNRLAVAASLPARLIAWSEAPAVGADKFELVTLDRSGQKIATLLKPGWASWSHLDLSPDNARLVANVVENGRSDLWTFDLARGVDSRLTSGQGLAGPPVWFSDGRRVLFSAGLSGQGGLYSQAADGSGVPALVAPIELHHLHASPDGKHVAYEPSSQSSAIEEIRVLSLENGAKPQAAASGKRTGHPRFSPDGRWLAYSSAETGRSEIYVQSFPSGSGRWKISSKGGLVPRWRRDGRELLFLDSNQTANVWSVEVTPRGTGLEFGVPVKLFRAPFANNSYFAMSADARRIYANLDVRSINESESDPRPLTLILNWAAGLKR
jgi:serine/threonine protein kinase/Tol biopolymer transport system component